MRLSQGVVHERLLVFEDLFLIQASYINGRAPRGARMVADGARRLRMSIMNRCAGSNKFDDGDDDEHALSTFRLQ